MFLIGLTLTSFILTYLVSSQASEEIVKSNTYIDLTNKSYWYEESFIVDSIALCLIFYKLLTIARINRSIHNILVSFENVSTPRKHQGKSTMLTVVSR